MANVRKVILLVTAKWGYSRQLLRGIIKYSRFHTQWSFYRESEELRVLSSLKDWHPDGVIAQVQSRDRKNIQKIIKMGLPVIIDVPTLEGPIIDNIAIIDTDNVAIGNMAAEHLLGLGLKSFAFFYGFRNKAFLKRGESFVKRVEQAGFKACFLDLSKYKGGSSWQKRQDILARWLKQLPKPVGLMACNDEHCRCVVQACRTAGLKMPRDVAIIGVDNDELECELSSPPHSSVAINAEKAGYEAAKLLDKMMTGEKIKKHVVIIEPTGIAVRQSTNIIAIEDPEVAVAVRFIHEHAKELIQVEDVVEAANLSRRTLERRFRKFFAHGLSKEIKRTRVEQITRMLVETQFPISQIALKLGYTSHRHLARYFRGERGISPKAYREKHIAG